MFDEFLQHETQRLKLPGLAVAISEGEREVFLSGMGYCDPARKEPVTPDTLFGVASITKLLTTIEILRLAEQGLLGIDDPVAQHFPQLQIAKKSPMRLRHLLSHSAGLPGTDSRFKATDVSQVTDPLARVDGNELPRPDETAGAANGIENANALVNYLNSLDLQLIAQPGECLNYSNDSFCLLGGLVQKLCNTPYATAIDTNILQRLGLRRSVMRGSKLASMRGWLTHCYVKVTILCKAGYGMRPCFTLPAVW